MTAAVRSPMVSPRVPMSSYSSPLESAASPRFQNSPLRRSLTSSDAEKASRLTAPPSGTPTSAHSGFEPSPVAPSSNGTEFTDIEEPAHDTETVEKNEESSDDKNVPSTAQPELALNTQASLVPQKPRSDEDEPPLSVIHAPSGFTQFVRLHNGYQSHDLHIQVSPPSDEPERAPSRPVPSPSPQSDITVKSPQETKNLEKNSAETPISPPTLETALTPLKDWSERATPRAQTRQEFEAFDKLQRPRSSLANIPESEDGENNILYDSVGRFQDTEEEIQALNTALAECWTLCNTLASLSYIHRERLFNFSGKGDMQEQAWKSCWRLCQKLYESRDDDTTSHVRPTLDLCRDFCQALFDVRVRENDVSDSVLRVSFELNNHLYNTHDRSLPEAFRERTLDFYITLCHRLMKQKTDVIETDSLLKACWALAEMLFSLRQSRREGRPADEELLGSAVQACWELCDLFREGWTQIRPDRGTPRPSQTTFTQDFLQAKRSGFPAKDDGTVHRGFPETPTTIFEDTINISPDEAPPGPNILVIGSTNPTNGNKWSSASSTMSTSTRSSISSAQTVTTPAEDPNLTLLKLLFVKAAINGGYQRNGAQNLQTFVKTMHPHSFGRQNWQVSLLENFKKVIVADPAFRNLGPPMQAKAVDVAQAVEAMARSGYYTWLGDLYHLVFGFKTEVAPQKPKVGIQT
ncbi:MAG: hypothetical protein Q9227_000352 [Pyrenula ochraceoflavens]